ncbi:hypothetical protein VFPFJ_09840 [Purpureocillium lilacinum]|uniref:Uncharacterized protein n=1 Tax=Purpureocillium lilacinum TaxID=33203 RepID=A0A179GN89_PURLI|nr:hypothetical protein VFPFJ_09840 [Purpureocillium lilacinum]OAQ79354.1 hypothetical protein VFPFJ_09840 [Purpureocillium lilacinum]
MTDPVPAGAIRRYLLYCTLRPWSRSACYPALSVALTRFPRPALLRPCARFESGPDRARAAATSSRSVLPPQGPGKPGRIASRVPRTPHALVAPGGTRRPLSPVDPSAWLPVTSTSSSSWPWLRVFLHSRIRR